MPVMDPALGDVHNCIHEEVPSGVGNEEGGVFTKPSKFVMEHYHAHGNS